MSADVFLGIHDLVDLIDFQHAYLLYSQERGAKEKSYFSTNLACQAEENKSMRNFVRV